KRPRWQQLADRLALDDPNGPLAGLLREVAADGGRGRLQDVLLRHVELHGLKQRFEKVLKLARELRDRYRLLPSRRPLGGDTTRPAGEVWRARRGRRRPFPATARARLSAFPGLHVPADGEDGALAGRTAAAIRERIWGWPVWHRLLNRLDDAGRLRTA